MSEFEVELAKLYNYSLNPFEMATEAERKNSLVMLRGLDRIELIPSYVG